MAPTAKPDRWPARCGSCTVASQRGRSWKAAVASYPDSALPPRALQRDALCDRAVHKPRLCTSTVIAARARRSPPDPTSPRALLQRRRARRHTRARRICLCRTLAMRAARTHAMRVRSAPAGSAR
eukprot:scaffold4182_cov384-Prasinococcus_capsulatus_cf.AAC.4